MTFLWKIVVFRCVMSMKRLAVISAVANSNHGGLNHTVMSTAPGSPPPPIHGVNVMLGGAMLSGIILVVFIMCYCCHKNARKQESHLPVYWRDSGLPLHVYTVEGQQCYDSEEFVLSDIQPPPTQGPPPAYDAVVPIHDKDSLSPARTKPDDSELPTYEAALRLEVAGHV